MLLMKFRIVFVFEKIDGRVFVQLNPSPVRSFLSEDFAVFSKLSGFFVKKFSYPSGYLSGKADNPAEISLSTFFHML